MQRTFRGGDRSSRGRLTRNLPGCCVGEEILRSLDERQIGGDLRAGEELSFDAFYSHEDQRSTSNGNSASNGTVNAVSPTAYGTNYRTATGTGLNGNTTVSGLCPGDSTAGLSGPGWANPPTQYQIYNNNLKISPCTGWQSEMCDRTDTVGLAFKKKHPISANFNLAGDVSYSRSVATNGMTGGSYATNTLAPYVAGCRQACTSMRLTCRTSSSMPFSCA